MPRAHAGPLCGVPVALALAAARCTKSCTVRARGSLRLAATTSVAPRCLRRQVADVEGPAGEDEEAAVDELRGDLGCRPRHPAHAGRARRGGVQWIWILSVGRERMFSAFSWWMTGGRAATCRRMARLAAPSLPPRTPGHFPCLGRTLLDAQSGSRGSVTCPPRETRPGHTRPSGRPRRRALGALGQTLHAWRCPLR